MIFNKSVNYILISVLCKFDISQIDTFGTTHAWNGYDIANISFTLADRLALLEYNTGICDNVDI